MTLLLWAFSLSCFEADMSDMLIRGQKREAEGRGLSCDRLGAGNILDKDIRYSMEQRWPRGIYIVNNPVPLPLNAAPRQSTAPAAQLIVDSYIYHRGCYVYPSVSVIRIARHGVSAGIPWTKLNLG